jgi:hypothetical protein
LIRESEEALMDMHGLLSSPPKSKRYALPFWISLAVVAISLLDLRARLPEFE